MHPEIENLINMALADDEVTEKERAIILRKAESLGLDKDEVEMILEGKIALKMKEKKVSQHQSKPESNKVGDIKKCPSCGAHVQSFATVCSDCGHEFRNTKANKGISYLFDTIQSLDINSFGSEMDYETKVASVISGWPIPNTKEDILEFLSSALPEATKKLGFWAGLDKDRAPYIYKLAWKSVCEKVLMKANFSMRNDKELMDLINQYSKKLKLKK